MGKKSFFDELKERNIYKVAVAYAVTGWVIVQLAAVATDAFAAPPWVLKIIIVALLLGFPVAIIFAWAFEITPDGIKRQEEVLDSESINYETGKKLYFGIIGLLCIVVLFFVVDRFWLKTESVAAQLSKTSVIPSVAVLPFDDFSKEGNQEWFANGLTEELLNSLARLEGLHVAARTSSFQFKKSGLPIIEIADSLGVQYIVEGSVRRAGNDMRITAQLIRAKDGYHMWSKTYKQKVNDVFKVQKDISKSIAAALDIYLDKEAREKMFQFGTHSVEAYEAYLKGRAEYDKIHLTKILPDSITYKLFTKATPWFKKAITIDPGFAVPYYYLSDPYSHYLMNYSKSKVDSLSRETAQKRMLGYFKQAIIHTEDDALRLMYKLDRTFLSDDWSELPQLIKKVKNNPNFIRPYIMMDGGWTKSLLLFTGHAKLMYKLASKALKRDPLDKSLERERTIALCYFAGLDRVIPALDSLNTDLPININNIKHFLYIKTSHFEKADSIAWVMTTSAADTVSSPYNPVNIIRQAARGDVKEARKHFKRLAVQIKQPTFGLSMFYYAVGNVMKANNMAAKLDSVALGPQKLLVYSNGYLGYLPFQVKATPNLAKLLKQANVKVEMRPFGKIEMPAIIQKEL